MLRVLVVVTTLAGCLFGGADDGGGSVTGKSWQPAQTSLMENTGGAAFDADDRWFSGGINQYHVYALDPATLLYDDYGAAPGMTSGSPIAGDSGTIHLLEFPSSDVFRLDGRAWTKVGTAPSGNLVIGPGDMVYTTDTETTAGMTTIARHPLDDWDPSHAEVVATVAGAFGVGFDALGHTLLGSKENTTISGTLDGGGFHQFYSCGSVQYAWCSGTPEDLQVDASGTLTFLIANDITGSKLYEKLASDDQPHELAPMPAPPHDNAYHVFAIATARDGTRYLAYGGNDLAPPYFYVLPPGASSFTEAPRLPDGAYGFILSPHGNLWAYSNMPRRGWLLK